LNYSPTRTLLGEIGKLSARRICNQVTLTLEPVENATGYIIYAGDRINVELFLSCYDSAATVEDIAIMVEVRYDSSVPV
jgi:hypothetical protein